jgi:hypothetical protein
MKRNVVLVILLLLMSACSVKPAALPPVPTSSPTETLPTALPSATKTVNPYPAPYPVAYPGIEPVLQVTRQPAPTEMPEPTFAPWPTLTQTITPTATPIRPTATFPPSLASLRIAFAAEKKLFIWFKGETKLLADMEEDPYWVRISSDGQIVAYQLSSGIWAINANGTGKRLLVAKDRIQVMNPKRPEKKTALDDFEWIPNTHRLLLNTQVDNGGQCCYVFNHDLYMVDADTSKLQTLLLPGKAGDIFDISPDGKLVALVSGDRIDLLNLTTREKLNLIRYEYVAYPSEVGWYVKIHWSSDSQYMMVVIPPPDIFYGTGLPTKIWKLPTNHHSPQLVSTLGPEFGLVTLSPNFQKIAGWDPHRPQSFGPPDVHIANVDGSGDEILPSGMGFSGWTPNSVYLILSDQNGHLVLSKKGSDPIELPFPGTNLRWVDGRTCLFDNGIYDSKEISLGFLDGSTIRLVGPVLINSYAFTR